MCGTFAGYNHLTYPYKGDTYNLWELSQARCHVFCFGWWGGV